MLQCQRMVGFENNARRNTLPPGAPRLMAKLGRASLALAGGALASLLLSGCATVGVEILPQVQPGLATSGGAQASTCTVCR